MRPKTTNQPYDLTTEHGRAQARAHSAHGAMLASEVETSLLNQLEKLGLEIEQLTDKVLAELNTEAVASAVLLEQLATFQSELGVRDKEAFGPILEAYRDERTIVCLDMQRLVKLIKKVRVALDIDEEEKDGGK
jgi:uncharacterized protein YbgA (DUF1722 family)